MCTADAARVSGAAFGSASEALRVANAAMDHLNSATAALGGTAIDGTALDAAALHGAALDGAALDGAACAEVLVALGEIQAKLTAAHARFLRHFDAANAHDADGYGSSSAWLTAKAGMSKKAARASVRQMRQLRDRPLLGTALAAGHITDSLAFTIADWTRKLPAEMRGETDRILLDAAAAGASLDDLATIAACAIERWRQRQPDPDDPDDGFDDRYVQVGTTFGGAAVIRGDLTPECAAAVRAVLEALGKKAGPEDDRTEGKRFHDALQLACELLLRAKLVPDRAGADTQVIAHIPLSQLRQLPGAQDLEDGWIRARLGEDGYLTGKDAEAAACDAQTVPVVTGAMDPTVIDRMIELAKIAAATRAPDDTGETRDNAGTGETGETRANGDIGAASDTGGTGETAGTGDTDGAGSNATEHAAATRSASCSGRPPCTPSEPSRRPDRPSPAPSPSSPRSRAPSPEAWRALRHAMARLAIDLVSGPAGVAAILRQGLLDKPYNTPSLPLDIGYSDSIPWYIRRAVLLRDRTCAWPKCDRPAVYCDVHHLRRKEDGGETSVENCALVCQFHHDVCIHRRGWQLILHPDGTTEARSPDGRQILRSHAPPAQQAA
jgi:hypothetical protein